MGRSKIGWACGVIAPWCLAIGLLASFSADAGEDISSGASFAPLTALPSAMPADLVPNTNLGLPTVFGLVGLPADAVSRQASLEIGMPADLATPPTDETEPRKTLKPNAHAFPSVDRTHRGDPFVGLRPSFESRLTRPGGVAAARMDALMLSTDGTFAFDGFETADGPPPGPDSVDTFQSDVESDTATTGPATAGTSPRPSASTPTLRVSTSQHALFDGSTPSVPRAVALASTTPAPTDATPVEVVAVAGIPQMALSSGAPNATIVPRSDRPDYASLIDQDQAAREQRCLAEAIYFEARSEPENGQAAVAQVVLNRVRSGLYPSTVCGVVFQNRQHRDACQFSFACDGHPLRVTEPEAWRTAVRVAHDVVDGDTYVAAIGDATHYHANYVRPRWARALEKMDVIGHHIFYQLRPGQS